MEEIKEKLEIVKQYYFKRYIKKYAKHDRFKKYSYT